MSKTLNLANHLLAMGRHFQTLGREHDAAPIHHDQRVFHEPASAEPRKGCPDGEGAHGAPAAWASRMADSRASTPFLAPV